ncbi:MAG: ectoine/hydroxyectoine ABC transporter substrate-binding protein EhuB [Nocardiopsaceae bacterium]|nr:ectoine/hydroxyectoine ABC transporter substrate-binding protein EhuB [Nocardiopsaceae bacterium]
MTESHLGGGFSRRDFLRRASVLGAAAASAPVLLSACESTGSSGSDVLSKAKKAGYINVGIAGEIPYGYTDKSGRITGEAPEVARAVFKKLGVPNLKAKQVDFDSLIQSLDAGDFDMVAAGMDIEPARCKHATFSIPDYQAPVAFLVPKGNPKNVTNFADAKKTGVKIAAEIGAVEITYATSSGVSSGQIETFSTPNEMLSAVTSGRVYAAMLTDISLASLVKDNPTAKVEVTPGFKPVIGGKPQAEVGGFVFRQDESSLVSAFNAQLKTLHSNGEWLKIVKPFGFTADNLPPAGLTTAQLCSGS